MQSEGFEPAIPAIRLLQPYASERTATGPEYKEWWSPQFDVALRTLNYFIIQFTFIQMWKRAHILQQVSLESNRYQLASSKAAANDVTATILLPVSPRTLPPGNTKLHDVFEWAAFQILVRTQLVLTEVLTCICLIDGCLSGEKSRDSDTHEERHTTL